MIIREKPVAVYDIEVFSNCFHCVVKDTETGKLFKFEISERKNQLKELVRFFWNCKYLICGYNCIHYDNPIINYILDYRAAMSKLSYDKICKSLFNLSNTIIGTDDFESWKKWKYAKNFETLDLLTMLFSQKLRVGLKEMQVTMQYKNVQEYSGDFRKPIPVTDIDNMIQYNINDVLSTEELLYRCKAAIELRLGIQEEYGVDVLSKDGMSIGMEILKVKYLEKTGKSWNDIKDLRSPCDIIDLNKVIFPVINFNTPVLQQLLQEMKSLQVSPGRKGYEKHFLLQDVEVVVGVGGIHTKNKPEVIIPDENQDLLDSDVNSLYPSLVISYGLVPPHLGEAFLEIYGDVRTERLYAKQTGQKIKNETLKLSLNGLTGNLQNEYSWVYSPETVMKIRINGQLFLLMLAERLIAIGAKIIQLNTDGVLYLIDKSKRPLLDKVLKGWEEITKLTLETEEFEAFYQYAINDYLGITKGYAQKKREFAEGKAFNKKGIQYTSLSQIKDDFLKKKGLFIDTVTLGKGMQPIIIPKAINDYLSDGIPIRDTIIGSRNLNDFITYQKVDKKFSVEYNGELVSRINRYYVSTKGYYLYKCVVNTVYVDEEYAEVEVKDTGRRMEIPVRVLNEEPHDNLHIIKYFYKGTPKQKRDDYSSMLSASGVRIVNNFDDITEFPNDINYNYYISEVNKILAPFAVRQLSLF